MGYNPAGHGLKNKLSVGFLMLRVTSDTDTEYEAYNLDKKEIEQ